jgi:hypothetical protein
MEKHEGIELLDAGNEEPFLSGPDVYCCYIAMGPFRG